MLGLVAEWLWPVALLPMWVRLSLGPALIVIAVVLVRPAMKAFRARGVAFDVRQAPGTLVTTGPYRISRNPGYLALILISLGIAVITDDIWIVGFAALATLVTRQRVVLPEERILAAQFGDAYEAYKARVRRWI
ncbi:methyltransferase family protein [Allgaiera indica]|uniref:methyltransferase family protein n=1 Tax=Allgaiera indica TaxID=765699 RepID=UPI001160076C|nr:isoprenylcysteine carboxylmethyltransferase family protein [Allgaiera indica]